MVVNGLTLLTWGLMFVAGMLTAQYHMEKYYKNLEIKKQQRFNRNFPTIEESMKRDGWFLND